MSTIARMLRALAVRSSRYEALYRKVCHPSGIEWARMVRERGDFYAIGHECSIDPHATIEGRAYIRMGNNVRLSNCAIFGHDGSVNMINRAYGLRLDSVGKIEIRDNVYIGYGAIVLPGVSIGPNAIVSVGSVVRSDVAEGDVVAGVPARRVGRLNISVEMLKVRNRNYPWRALIESRTSDFDAALEPELVRQRVMYFYGSER
jgi:acetyltransferase-like isoleucine patch superfamily enzyme